MALESVVEKAGSFGVDFKALRVIAVDDEPWVLQKTREDIEQFFGSYDTFTSPEAALEYIRGLPAEDMRNTLLLLDQFITRDLRRIEGHQGTDLAKKLRDEGKEFPTIIYSGSHAKMDYVPILQALNGAVDLAGFKGQMRVLREGDLIPIDFCSKSAETEELLAKIAGVAAIARNGNGIDKEAAYSRFFSKLEPHMPPPSWDLAQLAYEKGQVLWERALEFSERFEREIGEEGNMLVKESVKIPDPIKGSARYIDVDAPFSKAFLEICGFKFGIRHAPEEVVAFYGRGVMSAFVHEYSRTYRSFAECGETLEILTFYIYQLGKNYPEMGWPVLKSFYEGTKSPEATRFLEAHPQVNRAIQLITDFKKELIPLGIQLYLIKDRLNNKNYSLLAMDVSDIINHKSGARMINERKAEIVTFQDVVSGWVLDEVIYNADKSGRKRGITPEITADITDLAYEDLPRVIQDKFESYDPEKYDLFEAPKEFFKNMRERKFIKLSISDNCGGFPEGKDPNEMLNGSAEGRTYGGVGLPLIGRCQREGFYAVEIENRPGKGATFHFYFLKAPERKTS